MEIEKYKLRSNGVFSIIRDIYNKNQHPNQQNGLDLYIDVIDHSTGNINSVKLYDNTKGKHFKKQGSWYLNDFDRFVIYVPFQVQECDA